MIFFVVIIQYKGSQSVRRSLFTSAPRRFIIKAAQRGDKGVRARTIGLPGREVYFLFLYYSKLLVICEAHSIIKTRKNRLLTYLQIKIFLSFNEKILATFYSHPIANKFRPGYEQFLNFNYIIVVYFKVIQYKPTKIYYLFQHNYGALGWSLFWVFSNFYAN